MTTRGSALLTTAAALALGASLGFIVGRRSGPAGDGHPGPVAPAVDNVARMPAIRAPSGRNASVPSADGCESLQAELELARATVTELEKLLYGVPKPWTPDVPPEYQPDAVMERVRRVFSECDVPGDLVGFDCDEEPCFSIIDATGNATAVGDAVVGCPAWKDAWGTGVGSANRPVECRDGTRRTLLMLSPGSGPVTEEERAELLARGLSAEQMADLENSQKRLTARLASAEEQLCSRK